MDNQNVLADTTVSSPFLRLMLMLRERSAGGNHEIRHCLKCSTIAAAQNDEPTEADTPATRPAQSITLGPFLMMILALSRRNGGDGDVRERTQDLSERSSAQSLSLDLG